MTGCIFCKIIKDEIPSFKVMEDEENVAFLTIHPFRQGHSLAVPKKHVPYIFEMEDQDLASLMSFSKKVAVILKKAFNPQSGKIGVVVGGEEIPHAHVHLVPFDSVSDLSYSKARPASEDELKQALDKINKD